MAESPAQKAPFGKVVLAFFLDIITALVIGGYVVQIVASLLARSWFPVGDAGIWLLLIVGITGYYIVSIRYLGGTFWQRILKTRRRPSAEG